MLIVTAKCGDGCLPVAIDTAGCRQVSVAFALGPIEIVVAMEGDRPGALSIRSGKDASPIPDLATGLNLEIESC